MSNNEAPRKTGKWLRGDVPQTGWSCVEVREVKTYCEMCEVTPILYAHVMKHGRYPTELLCGCVCAGFMAEDPATEQVREFLYKWRKSPQHTSIEKIRRKGWRRAGHGAGHVFGWSFSCRKICRYSPVDDFHVEISNTEGWRFHVYHRHTEIKTSEPFATDISAATAGIEWAEILMANEQWAAAESETLAEEFAARRAEELASRIRHTAKRARELGREDVAVAVEARELTSLDAWEVLRKTERSLWGMS